MRRKRRPLDPEQARRAAHVAVRRLVKFAQDPSVEPHIRQQAAFRLMSIVARSAPMMLR